MVVGDCRGALKWRHQHWPDLDRAAWVKINRPGDDFDAPGRASTWTASSRQNVEMAYGTFLQWLARNEKLHSVDRLGERLDLDHIKSYWQELSTKVAPSTVWAYLQALGRAFSAMAPESDRTAFQAVLSRLKLRTRLSRQLHNRLISPVELVRIANEMMEEADNRKPGKKAAVVYRNGAIIMGAALCPLRRDAWTKIIIGRHLQVSVEHAWISLEAGELKSTRRPFRAELPPEYVVRLKRYLAHYRPILMSPSKADAGYLWVNWSGEALGAKGLSHAVEHALYKRSGKRFSFHMFRHAAATFIEDTAPDRSLMAAAVLHHADFRMTQEYYIRGQRTSAAHAYHRCIRQIVQKGRKRPQNAKRRVPS